MRRQHTKNGGDEIAEAILARSGNQSPVSWWRNLPEPTAASDVERWNLPQMCAVGSPACLFQVRYDKLQMFLISPSIDRQPDADTAQDIYPSSRASASGSRISHRLGSQRSGMRRGLSVGRQGTGSTVQPRGSFAEWEDTHYPAIPEERQPGDEPQWLPISDSASLVAELWRPLLAGLSYQNVSEQNSSGVASAGRAESPARPFSGGGGVGTLPVVNSDSEDARPDSPTRYNGKASRGRTETSTPFDSCLDMRCSHIYLRVTPQLVAALHANSCVEVFASPQLPLAPATPYFPPSSPEFPSGSERQSTASSHPHAEAVAPRGGAAGRSTGARDATKTRNLSSEDLDDPSVFSTFTGLMKGSQPSGPTAAASATSSQPRLDNGCLDGSAESGVWRDSRSLQAPVSSKLKDSVSIMRHAHAGLAIPDCQRDGALVGKQSGTYMSLCRR